MLQKQNSSYRKELYTDDAKKERFHRVASRRTTAILRQLRLIGNTANKNLYLYTDEELAKMFGVIDRKLTEVKGKFRAGKGDVKFKF